MHFKGHTIHRHPEPALQPQTWSAQWSAKCLNHLLGASLLHVTLPAVPYHLHGVLVQPDFDAVALPPCRILRMRRAAFRAALEATSLDPVLGYQVREPEQALTC